MKAGLLITGSGTLIYLTSHKKFMDDALIEKFESKGIEKFIAYEVPLEEAKKRYGRHFDVVRTDLKETEKETIRKTLEENRWNITATAKALGIARNPLHRKIKSYDLQDG